MTDFIAVHMSWYNKNVYVDVNINMCIDSLKVNKLII